MFPSLACLHYAQIWPLSFAPCLTPVYVPLCTDPSTRPRTDPSICTCNYCVFNRGADKSLARPGRKQARKHVRDARNFNNIETRAVIKFLFLQGKAPKEIHTILTETLACFLPGRTKDLSAPLLRCLQLRLFTNCLQT